MTTRGDQGFTVQAFDSSIAQEPFAAQAPDLSRIGSLLRLGPCGASLAELLRGWQDLCNKHDTFFNYLTTALREEVSLKARFLALVPAIESYHTAEYGDGPMSRKDFREYRKAVSNRLKEAEGVSDDDVAWVKKWTNPFGSYELRERLRQLLGDLSPALREQISLRIDPIPDELVGILSAPEDVWHIMGKVRNNLAHGGPRPTPQQLVMLTRLAHTMAIGLTLRQLNVSDDSLVQVIRRGEWTVV